MKVELKSKLGKWLHEIERRPLKPRDKIRNSNLCVYSKIKLEFTVDKVARLRIKQHLGDNLLTKSRH